MGQLEIRRSSARLNNLGQFRMPELDNGSARAFEAQANAAKAAADAAGMKGRAEAAGLSRRGQIVNETLQHLGRLAIDLVNRENERVATNAFIENEKERNLFMTGNGTPENPGMMNQPFDNAATWLEQLKEENQRRLAARTKDMNPAQRRIFMDKVNAREIEWQKRIGERAAAQTMKNEVATAASDVEQAKGHAIAGFSDPTFRDKSIREFYDAKAHELDVRLVPEGARRTEMRKATEDLLLSLARQKFTEWGNETYDNGDPSEVERLWTERGKALESLNGKVPTNELIRQHLGGDTADKAHQALIAERFAEAKARAVARAHALQSQNWRDARQDSAAREIELLKSPVPEDENGKAAYYDLLSKDYAKLAENPLLAPQDRLSYLETSRRIGATASRISSPDRDQEYGILLDNIKLGYIPSRIGDSESFVPYSPEQMKRDVDAMFNAGRLTVQQWSHLSGMANEKHRTAVEDEQDEAASAFLNAILGKYAKMIPSAVKYHADRNAFEFTPTQATAKKGVGAETPVPDGPSIVWGKDDDDEDATYGQLVQVANAVLAQRRGTGTKMTTAQMMEQFDREFGPTARGRAARSAAEKINMLETASKAW